MVTDREERATEITTRFWATSNSIRSKIWKFMPLTIIQEKGFRDRFPTQIITPESMMGI